MEDGLTDGDRAPHPLEMTDGWIHTLPVSMFSLISANNVPPVMLLIAFLSFLFFRHGRGKTDGLTDDARAPHPWRQWMEQRFLG